MGHNDELQAVAAEVLRRTSGDDTDVAARIAEAMTVFAPLGWALSGVWPYPGALRALKAAADGATAVEIDDMLTDIWNGEHSRWLEIGVSRLRRGGNAHWPFEADLWRRVQLVEKAIAHHQAGAYEASIPILFAQIEGLSYDITGKAFFSKWKPIPAVDDRTLAGMGGNIETVREICNADVTQRQSLGQFSRHGVMHGRELAYDTKVNSTKALVLTISVFEHWLPLADGVALRLRAEHEQQVAGSGDRDESGRLVDDRGVPEVRNIRRDLEGRYMSWLKTVGLEPFNVRDDIHRLALTHGADPDCFEVHGDNADFWWSYRLPSGHHLGWAAKAVQARRKPPHDSWWWDAPTAPVSAPWDDPTGWSVYDGDAGGAWQPDELLI